MLGSRDAVIDQGIVGEHFDQPIRRRIECKHACKNAARRLKKELGVWCCLGMIGKKLSAMKRRSARSSHRWHRRFLYQTPVRTSRIERIQNDVCFGVVMMLNELSDRVITNNRFEASATRNLGQGVGA